MTQDNSAEYAGHDADIAALAALVIAENRRCGRTIALAESCTGGMVAAALTGVAGSSDVFVAGLVTYSNAAKTALLGVDAAMIAAHGAVSLPCARAMAIGAVVRTGASLAVSITGVAGPGGGSAEKPVGTVVFGRACQGQAEDAVMARRIQFAPDGSRAQIRHQAALFALNLLLPDGNDAMPGA